MRLLIVDDSPLFGDLLIEALGREPGIDVVGVATDGQAAVEMVERLHPAVVIMDIHMPKMGGLDAIATIMAKAPTPILVMSAEADGRSATLAFEAIRRGALEVAPKPTSWPMPQPERMALAARLRLLAGVPVVRHPASTRLPTPATRSTAPRPPVAVVGIAASTGGPAALARILGELPPDFPAPVLVVQHIAQGFTPSLARWLSDGAKLPVRVARHGAIAAPGEVVLAPEDRHLVLGEGGRLRLTDAPPVGGHRPSGTVLLESLAERCGPGAVGVVLTGMGTDGADGLLAIRRAGGFTLGQDEPSSVVYGMPRAAYELEAVCEVLPLVTIARTLRQLVVGPPRGVAT